MMLLRRLAVGAVLALVVGCTTAPPPTPPARATGRAAASNGMTPTTAPTVALSGSASLETTTVGELSFTHDSRWLPRPYLGPPRSSGGTYTYVSTEPVDEHCTTAGGGMSCIGPGVAHLKAHGVFATWSSLEHPGLRFDGAAGEQLLVDGRPALWTVPGASAGDTSCADSGAMTSALGRVLLWSQGSGDEVALLLACLQSPDELPAVKAMFTSARWADTPVASEFRTPPAGSLATASFNHGHLEFRHPSGWTALEYNSPSAGGGTYGFVSNRKLRDPCHHGTCGEALAVLGAGGVYVRWEVNALPGAGLDMGRSENLVVGGVHARWATRPLSDCSGLGPAISAEGRAQSPAGPVLVMSACIDSSDDVAAVKAMFASVQFAL